MAGSMHSITANPADIITGPLEKHFPVSTGTDHRDKEEARGAEADLPVYEEPTNSASQVFLFFVSQDLRLLDCLILFWDQYAIIFEDVTFYLLICVLDCKGWGVG